MRIILNLIIAVILMLPITVNGQDADKIYQNALTEYKSGNYAKSLEYLREIIKPGNQNPDLHILAAHNYAKLKDIKPAADHLYAAIRIKPDDQNLTIDLIRLYASNDRYKGAVELAESSVKKYPDNFDLKLIYASILIKFNKLAPALTMVENLKQLKPDDYRPLALEATIYYMQRDFEKSEISLKWALSISAKNPNLKNNLALVYEQMAADAIRTAKDKEKAKQFLEQARGELTEAIVISANPSYAENQKRITNTLNSL